MNFKTTLILLIAVLLVGGYAYFFEYKGSEKKKEKEEQQKTLLSIKKEDVAEVRIEGTGQPVRIVSAPKNVWEITAPIKAKADESTISRILGNVENLKYEEVVEDKPKDLAQFELDKPKMTLRVTLKKSGGTRSVMLGAKNPVENAYYLRVNNDPRVYLVNGSVGDISSTTLFDLRDKKLTDFATDKVISLALNTSKNAFLFQKEGELWKLKAPVQSPAADNEVSSLLSSLESLQASKFADNPQKLGEYGLDKPKATAEIQLDKGLKQRVLFGSKQGEDIYVKVEGSPDVALVNDTFTTQFEKNIDEWREKKLVVFNRFDVDQFHIKSAGKEYAFTKNKEEEWTQTSPSKGSVESEKIQEMLEKLENAQIEKYGEQAAISAPVLEVSMTLRDWQDKVTKKRLQFGPPEKDGQPVKNDDYPTVVFADTDMHSDLQKALAEIKPKKADEKPQTSTKK